VWAEAAVEVGMLIVKERLVDQVAVLLSMVLVVQEQQIKVMLVELVVTVILAVVLVKLGL
tara:strand:+ start:237 stop:416 length:180 start_codon:yes stop_codon:yes gene_type:complete